MLLFQLLSDKIKSVKNQIQIAKRNPSCEIHSAFISKKAKLGKNLKIRRGTRVNRHVSIGENGYINSNSMLLSGEIGRYCSIGHNCIIGAPNHPLTEFTTFNALLKDPQLEQYFTFDNYSSPPVIGHDVWIASNVVILQGVTIGNSAVIAAGSVVTRDVEAGWIYGGVPAKKIRQRVDESTLSEKLGANWFLQDKQSIIEKILS